jgi:hypothetical protein
MDTIALSENPAPPVYDPAYSWIVRLNWGYGSTGTLPSSGYSAFAQSAADYVAESKGCSRWVIGNEPNLSREWPNGQPIFPWHYADCYKQCYRAIHAVPGHGGDEVLIAAPGPWNAELKYAGNPNGDWIKYFEDVIDLCDSDVDGEAEIDGFSIHSYCHGYNVALVTSSARMNAPFQNRHYEFRTYRDYVEAIPDHLSHLPCYLTEANGNGPWQAVGLMPAMLSEINGWNQTGKPPISAVIFYRYPRYDDFYIDGRADVIAEYKEAVGQGYQSPPMGDKLQDTFLPHIPNESTSVPALPPRQWDERLTQRGVSVTTPTMLPRQSFWRVVKGEWLDEQQSQGRHHIYVDVLDEKGQRVVGKELMVEWPNGGFARITTEAKPGEPYAANYPMSPSKNEFGIHMANGLPTERVRGIGMGAETPGGFNAGIHTSTSIVFQRTMMPAATVPVTPAPPPGPAPAIAYITAPAGVNLRAAPINGKIIIAIPYSAQVRITGVGQTGWYKVRYGEHEGWAASQFISVTEPKPLPVPAPVEPPVQPPASGDKWARSIAFVRRWEGGYVDDPRDSGGATNKGITLGTYTRWRQQLGQQPPTKDDLRNITDDEVNRIYFEWYWLTSGADKLPWPLCLAHFDTSVNAGPGRAAEMLAKSKGDFQLYVGHLGIWYTTLDDFEHFGRAWARRRFELLLEARK